MPAVSKAQQALMAMCEHSPGKVRGKCPSKAVAKEFASTKTKGLPQHKQKR